ncbi:phage antirepressor [Curtobacterium flaccumfaciens]|uniref:phage antirepressor n=1 Tax=Curtobacterium flaccumfaciens TaxID=2035 RepID=UPI001BDEBD13|nr:phage antirepressor KilAC domain-containing protein [Curtobacterium flaccumfaciens]MBT1630425.1 phage antirepressor KilAC domain-containing protein [Curtobacterium flaccumfaciens pv. oortii]MCX2843905.1 phage antirepressor KilAC domain-containing protein [Curtobacterium flaccumfaciens pv. oortii]
MNSTDVTPFNYDGHQVRTVTIDDEPWFVGVDVCRALLILNPRDALGRLDPDGVGIADVIDSMGRTQAAKTINESGLYELIFQSRTPGSVEFRRWVTHEVLPSIRRKGSYSVQPSLPQSYAEALRELAGTVEQNAALEAKAAENAPKVLFADSVSTSPTAILVGDLAKILKGNGVDVGANRLFEVLRNDGYLIRRKGTDWNMPTQRSMELGLFKVKETAVAHSDGHVTVNKTPKVTGKGQAYFVNRYSALRAVA